jgi:glycosyltransferase involved in cell wall biosynthesis
LNKKVLIINHVFWPDPHITARLISELSEELSKRNWNITALISNRSYHDRKTKYSTKEGLWNGVKYKRVYVPPLNQKSNIQRLITSLWLIFSWTISLFKLDQFDVIIIGTNPPFIYLILPFLKLFKRKSKLIMWGFDLYPEAIIVSGGFTWRLMGRLITPITKFCYSMLDVIVVIGPCMRSRYRMYNHEAHEETLTPWSFVEPNKIPEKDQTTRNELFGNAKVGLLYSGTIGQAHEFSNFLLLARELRKRNASVAICFAGFGTRFDDLKIQVTSEDTNIRFAGFVKSDEELKKRISSADLMLISLKDSWTGISVPSKFFGALASGKAVVFSGSKNSALSKWTEEYNVGMNLSKYNIDIVADYLESATQDLGILSEVQNNAFKIYHEFFSKKIVCNKWNEVLLKTLNS